ncbi:MAG: hypothetical protein ACPGO3_06970 [Magnetospiraceae bacterium]
MESLHVSALHVVDDVKRAGASFAALGFTRAVGDSPDCVGWLSTNGSSVILVSRTRAQRDYGWDAAHRMRHGGVPYIHVKGIEAALRVLPTKSRLLGREHRQDNLRELVVETETGPVVLAETAR